MPDVKKPNLISGAPPSLKCSKCGGSMVQVPNQPNARACGNCGNRSSLVKI